MKVSVGMSTCTIISLSFGETHSSQCPVQQLTTYFWLSYSTCRGAAS